MKNILIAAFACCLLFLGGCGIAAGTNLVSSSSSSQHIATATPNLQSTCSLLRDRQAQFNQEAQRVSAQLDAHPDDELMTVDGEKSLMRLHRLLAQVQAQLQECKTRS